MPRAFVKYVQPCYEELRKLFDWVGDNYQKAAFEPVDCCKNVSREDREIDFEYFRTTKRSPSTGEVLAEMDEAGLRPALYEEFICFLGQNPDEQRKFAIIALGSVLAVPPSGAENFAFARGDACDRGLYTRCGCISWGKHNYFLVVKK